MLTLADILLNEKSDNCQILMMDESLESNHDYVDLNSLIVTAGHTQSEVIFSDYGTLRLANNTRIPVIICIT